MSLADMQIEEMKTDPVVSYLTKVLDEARFDQILPDGSLWCSDSNASLDPHQLAKDIREIIAKENANGQLQPQ